MPKTPPEEVCADVDWKHIALGKPGDGDSCAITLALMDVLPNSQIEVQGPDEVFIDGFTYHSEDYDEALEFISEFDEWGGGIVADLRPRNFLGLPVIPADSENVLKPQTFCFVRVDSDDEDDDG